ncbi:MAG: peptidylprolyl isomerase [Proteobacteria bacterium]|nr:peptidylprolyl isomerase [Pseudomonadota bacterium]
MYLQFIKGVFMVAIVLSSSSQYAYSNKGANDIMTKKSGQSENAASNKNVSNEVVSMGDQLDQSQLTQSKDKLLLKLKDGAVEIELYKEQAPAHVQRVIELASEGFYNGITFHRVIPGFMAQAGDPRGDGTGGSDKSNLKAEFNEIQHVRGVVSMARAQDINSANSQFFIMLGDAAHLNGQYTAFGRVISGMEYVDNIKAGNVQNNGMVPDPKDKIIEMSFIAASAAGSNTQDTNSSLTDNISTSGSDEKLMSIDELSSSMTSEDSSASS